MNTLTDEELKIFNRMEQAKLKHNLRQKKYIDNQKKKNPNYNADHSEYMRKYNANIREKYMTVAQKIAKENIKLQPPKTVEIPNIEAPKVDRRTKKGQEILAEFEVRPSYQIRRRALAEQTVNTYMSNLNLVQRELLDKDIRDVIKKHIKKLLTNSTGLEAPNVSAIISELSYLKDIDTAIRTLRAKNPIDNTFKAKLQAIVSVTSRIPSLKDQYQKTTKLAIQINDNYEEGRAENAIKEGDEDKIIDVTDKQTIKENIDKLDDPMEKLIYAVYMYVPPRRVKDYYLLTPTTEKDYESLDTDYNYLVLTKPIKIVFNNYKTKSKFKQQVFDLPDDLAKLFRDYIQRENLDSNHFIFHQSGDKRLTIGQSNFSAKVKKIFTKLYGAGITVTNVRQSWATAQEGKRLKDRQWIAKWMGHNVEQQLRYTKKK